MLNHNFQCKIDACLKELVDRYVCFAYYYLIFL